MKDSAPYVHPPAEETPHGCYEGKVFIGYLEMTDEGEEVEVITSVPCRRCQRS